MVRFAPNKSPLLKLQKKNQRRMQDACVDVKGLWWRDGGAREHSSAPRYSEAVSSIMGVETPEVGSYALKFISKFPGIL